MTARKSSSNRKQHNASSARPSRVRGRLVPKRYQRHLHIVVLAVGFVTCGIASLHLGQDNNWDLRNYHYYNPYAFLTDRIGYDFAPAQRQTYLNPFQDLPLYLGTTYLKPKLYGFLLGGIQGLSFGLLFAVCFSVLRHLGPNSRLGLSLLCSGLGLYAPVFVGELGASQNDTLIGLLVLLSLYLFIRTLSAGKTLAERGSRKTLIIASLVFGLAVGLKLTFMLYALAAAAALLVVERTWRNRAAVIAIWSGAFLAGFLIANGYWMVRIWNEFGNPLFPFFNNVFKSPWLEAYTFEDRAMVPTTVWEALTRPFAIAYGSPYADLQNEIRDGRYAVLYVLLVGIAIAWLYRRVFVGNKTVGTPLRSPPLETRFLLVFFVVAFVVWEAQFSIVRYASCLEAIAPLLVVVVTLDLMRRYAVRTAVIMVAFVLTAGTMHPVQHPRVDWGDSFWEVQVPAVRDPQNSLIIIANPRPWAYLIPMFPPEIRWVSLNTNLTRPGRPSRMQTEIRILLATHGGDMYLLSRAEPSLWIEHDRRVLASYGLSVGMNLGKPIVTKHSREGLHLWPVRRRRTEGN